jgi:hypothetical protein
LFLAQGTWLWLAGRDGMVQPVEHEIPANKNHEHHVATEVIIRQSLVIRSAIGRFQNHLGTRIRSMCGVFGIYGHPEAANLTYLGLHALQHRGQ